MSEFAARPLVIGCGDPGNSVRIQVSYGTWFLGMTTGRWEWRVIFDNPRGWRDGVLLDFQGVELDAQDARDVVVVNQPPPWTIAARDYCSRIWAIVRHRENIYLYGLWQAYSMLDTQVGEKACLEVEAWPDLVGEWWLYRGGWPLKMPIGRDVGVVTRPGDRYVVWPSRWHAGIQVYVDACQYGLRKPYHYQENAESKPLPAPQAFSFQYLYQDYADYGSSPIRDVYRYLQNRKRLD
jgi:hypothetical protein